MAISKDNIMTSGLSGTVGRQVVFRNWKGQTVVAALPRRRSGKVTKAQKDHYLRFKEASVYAKATSENEILWKEYAQKAQSSSKRLTAYNVAIADYLKAPDISEMDWGNYTGQAGEQIRIRATDDFRVEKVTVEIQQSDGTVIENGVAKQSTNGLDWIYTTTSVNTSLPGSKIIAYAVDVPGNATQAEETI